MTFIKQLLRSPVRTVAFALLLALSGAMLCIGVNAYVGVNEQVAALNETYTTIAVPDYRIPELSDVSPDDDWKMEDWFGFIRLDNKRKQLLIQAKEAAAVSEHVSLAEKRSIFTAYILNSRALISKSVDWKEYRQELDQPYSLAVFAILCSKVESYESTFDSEIYISDDDIKKERVCTVTQYTISADVEESLSLHSDYKIPSELIIDGNIMNNEGEIPFKQGRRYLVWGRFADHPVKQTGLDTWEVNESVTPMLTLNNHIVYRGPTADLDQVYEKEGKLYRITNMLEAYPICTELPEGMDAEAFLSSDEGRVWREGIMKVSEITLQSVPVISTDKLESMLLFNNHEAYITQGRSFNIDEYKNGEKVCIINADYAQKNGLRTGDALELSFYNSGYEKQEYVFGGHDPNNYTTLIAARPYTPDVELCEAEEYTVVGIYRSIGFSFGNYSFSPNTVFIPASSAAPPPAPEGYETDNMDVLYSIVLKNGMSDAFEAELEAQGYGGCFLYFDQGYAQASEGIDAMVLNANRLMLFSAVLFLVAAVLFAYLYTRWAGRTAGIMRLIGAKPGQVFSGMSACALLVLALSLTVGCILSYIMYDGICGAVFGNGGSEMAYSVPWALTAATVGLMLIMGACMCFFAGVIRSSTIKLVNSGQKG